MIEFAFNMGDVLVTLVGLLITYALNSINSQIKEIKLSVKELAVSLIALDKRVVRLETKSGITEDR